MENGKKSAEQEPKLEKQVQQLDDLEQELTAAQQEEVKGGGFRDVLKRRVYNRYA